MTTLAAPTPLKNKRKVFQDDFTPRSSHIDKKAIPGTPGAPLLTGADTTSEATKEAVVPRNIQKENMATPRAGGSDAASPSKMPSAARGLTRTSSTNEHDAKQALSERGLNVESPMTQRDEMPPSAEKSFAYRSASLGSVLSQPDFSASVLQHVDSLADEQDEEAESPTEMSAVDAPEADEPELSALPRSRLSAPVSDNDNDNNSDVDEAPATATPRPASPVRNPRRSPSPMRPTTGSPTRTPRLLRDFQMPMTTPRNLVEAALQGRGQHPIQQLQKQHLLEEARAAANESQDGTPIKSAATPSATASSAALQADDLLSFQTPVAKSGRKVLGDLNLLGDATLGAPASAALHRFRTADGEEMLLDMTPRVYSPRSIPLYTLDDMDMVKREFGEANRLLEEKVESLYAQLAASISHTNHNAALEAQGASLHTEYSKKHMRKVMGLKQDWNTKLTDKLTAQKNEFEREREALQAQLRDRDAQLEQLTLQLAQERLEKKEVIEMGEQILAMVGNTASSS